MASQLKPRSIQEVSDYLSKEWVKPILEDDVEVTMEASDGTKVTMQASGNAVERKRGINFRLTEIVELPPENSDFLTLRLHYLVTTWGDISYNMHQQLLCHMAKHRDGVGSQKTPISPSYWLALKTCLQPALRLEYELRIPLKESDPEPSRVQHKLEVILQDS